MLYWGVPGASEQPRIIGIVGPTAIGKTAVGLALAERLSGKAEIVSADSMQVYRRMDIGTAKPTQAEQARAAFHLIDVVDPDEEYTLADYQAQAAQAFDEIAQRGHIALLAGGTGLYVRAATTRLSLPHAPPDPALRERWLLFAKERGQEALVGELAKVDPEAANRIHGNDTKRILRALEVYETTGRPLSDWHRENRELSGVGEQEPLIFGLTCDRSALYAAIERRVDQMMQEGLVAEIEGLRQAGYNSVLKPMQSLGYKQINAYLDASCDLESAVHSIKQETRHFARRQLIWFRADKRIQWLPTDGLAAHAIADRIVSAMNALDLP